MVGSNWKGWQPAAAGLMATLLGVGLGRFAYTPLLPAMVAEGWLSATQAALLGAFNLAGYLLGALAAAGLGRRFGAAAVLRAALGLIVLSLGACGWNGGMVWLGCWRFLAGVTGAVLMILPAPLLMARVPADSRPMLAGLVFSGMGFGIILAGAVLPLLAAGGVALAWALLGLLGAGLAALSWRQWQPAPLATPHAVAGATTGGRGLAPVLLFALAYGADGMGFVPHTLFLSDFVARGLGWGLKAGGFYWTILGLGAVLGPLLAARVARRTGFPLALTGALLVKAAAVGLPLLTTSPAALALSAFLVGALTPGSVALASGVAGLLAGPAGHTALWGRMTLLFALFQAAGGYGMTALFATTGAYLPLFALGAAVLLLAGGLALAGLILLQRKECA
ncbi:YbfB/YjiJ family MFS transporter [Niveispirillum sp. BGYR6]|uniref:YbfB/YjiJ family MFS transporter n=1 Tax=Niveispirillum sp. BGYR6 TaxID=2971249 RepID=UPI0022B9BA92|nr:YbfB/YjiJ family MFS transporter [Niveispirillum sp. BGYR6]MDG5495510.1 YbfB/YjiJ family MFS transporter [Niveispirillum sp. BGYR6]